MATTNSWNNTINAANSAITLNSGTNNIAISTDASATTISIGTGGAVKALTLGSTNSTSTTTLQNGSGAMAITSTNGAITMNSGTGTVGIGTDATAATYNFATGAGAKVVSLGTTNSTSSLALKYGTADFTLASATGTVMSALDTGEIVYPLQPAFLGVLPSADNNVTGNSGTYTLGSVTALTEIFDQNGDFNTNGTFTAPVTGKYDLNGFLSITGCTIATFAFINLLTSNRTYTTGFQRTASSANFYLHMAVFADMDAADTSTFTTIAIGEAANTDDVAGDGTPATSFAGKLVC